MENISIIQHKIYVENSKSGEKPQPLSKRQSEKKYSLCEKLLQPHSHKFSLTQAPDTPKILKFPNTHLMLNLH